MMTITSPFVPLSEIISAPQQSWLAAFAEAMVGALAALLAGPAGVDPAVGFRH